jgi:propanediol dehydratase large subunit
VTASVPDGMREVIAENLCVMLRDLESCAGNDTLMSFSDIRRTAHTLPLLLAGADFLFSGFGSIPAYDNAFGPVQLQREDLDDYLVVQRDWGFEGGLRARDDAELLPLRRRAAEACRAVYEELGLASFDDADVDAVVQAHGSLDVPAPDPQLAPTAGDAIMARGITILDAVAALARRGYTVEAERVLGCSGATRRRLPADRRDLRHRHARAVGADRPERLRGSRHRLRMSAERRAEVAHVRQERTRDRLVADQTIAPAA